MTDKMIRGQLTMAPELRYTPNGVPVCAFRIITPIQDEINCEAWEELGERIANRDLQPGRQIMLTGYWKTRKWKDLDNQALTKKVFVVKSGRPLSG